MKVKSEREILKERPISDKQLEVRAFYANLISVIFGNKHDIKNLKALARDLAVEGEEDQMEKLVDGWIANPQSILDESKEDLN